RRADRHRDVAPLARATNVDRIGRRAGGVAMSAEVHCSQRLLLQADFDGELDAAKSAELEAHVVDCAICTAALARLQRSRALLAGAQRVTAPDRLRDRVRELAASKTGSQGAPAARAYGFATKIRYVASGAGVGAVAVGVLAFVLLGAEPSRVA